MVSQMRENQGGFGVTDEGDLVSQMRGLPSESLPWPGGLVIWSPTYPLVNIQKTMENHIFFRQLTISMAIFNSYVKLPEGRLK